MRCKERITNLGGVKWLSSWESKSYQNRMIMLYVQPSHWEEKGNLTYLPYVSDKSDSTASIESYKRVPCSISSFQVSTSLSGSELLEGAHTPHWEGLYSDREIIKYISKDAVTKLFLWLSQCCFAAAQQRALWEPDIKTTLPYQAVFNAWWKRGPWGQCLIGFPYRFSSQQSEHYHIITSLGTHCHFPPLRFNH